MLFLSFGFSFEDLYDPAALQKLDEVFLAHLAKENPPLADCLKCARNYALTTFKESELLLDLAPYLEDFIGIFFNITKEIEALQCHAFHLAPLYRCKRLFVKRQAAKAFLKEEAQTFNGYQLKEDLSQFLKDTYSDLNFARHVLQALENESENKIFLDMAKKYAAWALHQENPSVLFRLPRTIDPEFLFPLTRERNVLTSPHLTLRKGLDYTEPEVSSEDALDQAHYCIICHPQNKDSCSKGLSETHKGCPLGQKISEMNTLRIQGYILGALAMVMVDNPLVAATGHRICNECMKGCIFQKQDPVNIPSIETEILESVLSLPWGVEIYGLLSRWNPLNLKRPWPKDPTGYKVLIAGMGPAGFTIAHYLLNEGHRVVGADELKIDPLDADILSQPVCDWAALKEPLSQRTKRGFGGVMEYGVTARWDKNALKLIRLLLERRSHFTLCNNVRFGETLTLSQAFACGFDHVALCLGAGRPNSLDIPNSQAHGIKLAADFLKTLHLSAINQKGYLDNLQIRLPLCVVGGGLTAVDAAAEALAYYPIQVEEFLKQTEVAGGLSIFLSKEEIEVAEEFLNHARALRQGEREFLKNAVTIVYRNRIQDSPSYRLNGKELELALTQGVAFVENANPYEIEVDSYGHIKGLKIKTKKGQTSLPCHTLLVAIGTQPNEIDPALKKEGEGILMSYQGEEKVSFLGDLHPIYQGTVVKAMASAKKGYPLICEALLKRPPSVNDTVFKWQENERNF